VAIAHGVMAERESPPDGGTWPNNGEVYERARVTNEELADKAEAYGDVAGAKLHREIARQSRVNRDRCYSEHLRHMMNRRVRHGTW
jgi:hypothetical protein